MPHRLNRRLEVLEQAATPQRIVCLVVDEFEGETTERAIAQRFPDGPPPDVRLVLVTTGITRAETA